MKKLIVACAFVLLLAASCQRNTCPSFGKIDAKTETVKA
jgi:predicted small secreted protein